jgi:hypothetical protein
MEHLFDIAPQSRAIIFYGRMSSRSVWSNVFALSQLCISYVLWNYLQVGVTKGVTVGYVLGPTHIEKEQDQIR